MVALSRDRAVGTGVYNEGHGANPVVVQFHDGFKHWTPVIVEIPLKHLQDHQFWIWVEVPDDHLAAGDLLLVGRFEHAIKAIRQRSHLSVVKRDPLIRVLPGELTVLT